jgi:hypothetical protein
VADVGPNVVAIHAMAACVSPSVSASIDVGW